ncbi:amidohydrolase family protein [Mycolicibacterium sp. P9-22]|uniref:amidohydrolase family protein n=1 Tax=Mycolicibacterium sp. P9-22 TaxID=2024613 RepID=UPI0011ECB0AA|nr:amidohydrolase family protein [Mycolicibacterium sp. P9-22]
MSVLDRFAGRMMDLDSHEMTPAHQWAKVFGPAAGLFADVFKAHHPDAPNTLNPSAERDDAPLEGATPEQIWMRGGYAPGSWDMGRRLEFMDHFGIERMLVFATGPGGLGFICLCEPPLSLLQQLAGDTDVDLSALDLPAIGRMMCGLHNDWCIETAKISDRLRPVASLDTSTLDGALAEVERIVAGGVRAVMAPSGVVPAGMSPGHPDLDPLWAVLAEHRVPFLLHVGGDFGLMASSTWPSYGVESNKVGTVLASTELNLDPYSLAQMHVGVEHYLTAMICGGVFDRHPELVVGCIETAGYWVGPLARRLDGIAATLPKSLERKPSEYFASNIRATCFWWERVDLYIERDGLEDVYALGTDYPHFEGGMDPMTGHAQMLERLGPDVMEKFFVENGRLLLPD